MPDTKKTAPFSFKPIVVLFIICVVAASFLAGVNALTAPILQVRKDAELADSLRALLPESTTYTELECDLDRVVSVYRDNNGTGYAIITVENGFHGEVAVTTALDPGGRVIGIVVDASHETAGVGTKVGEPDFLSRFAGKSDQVDDVEILTGATVSSKAVLRAVNNAIAAYKLVKEGQA